jgi:hypothetical protein
MCIKVEAMICCKVCRANIVACFLMLLKGLEGCSRLLLILVQPMVLCCCRLCSMLSIARTYPLLRTLFKFRLLNELLPTIRLLNDLQNLCFFNDFITNY